MGGCSAQNQIAESDPRHATEVARQSSPQMEEALALRTSRVGADESFSVESRLWAITEQLKAKTPATAQEAVAALTHLNSLAAHESVRDYLIKSLRTESPAHFKFDHARAKTFEALTPYLSDKKVLLVFVEELESNLQFKESCSAVIKGINGLSKIDDQSLQDRIFKLFITHADRRREPTTDLLSELAPNLSSKPSNKIVSAMIDKAHSQASEYHTAPDHRLLKALALTRDSKALSFLKDMAELQLKRDFKYSLGEFTPFYLLGGIVAGTVVGLSIGAGLEATTWGWVAFSLCTVLGFNVDPIMNFFSRDRKINNKDASEAAIDSLKALGADSKVTEVLEDLSSQANKELIRAVIDSRRQAIDRVNSLSLIKEKQLPLNREVLFEFAESPVLDIKIWALEQLSGTGDMTKVKEILSQATNSEEKKLRQAAYRLLDEIAERERGKA